MNTINMFKKVANSLKAFGIEAAEKDAEILVRHGLGINTVEIYRDNPELSEEQIRILEGMLHRRLTHEPIQYILGYEEFLGMKIFVHPGVLIPRPETEFLAEQAIKAVRSQESGVRVQKNSKLSTPNPEPCILDLCTGSGCLAIALAKEFPDFKVYGTDISETAVECANKNAEINRIKNATFLQGNLFKPFEKLLPSPFSLLTFDLIISNPPYIKKDEIKHLQPEIKDWEPVNALDGGRDGLDFYRKIFSEAGRYLNKNGKIILEIGFDQSDDVTLIAKGAGFKNITTIKDYAGIERILKAEI